MWFWNVLYEYNFKILKQNLLYSVNNKKYFITEQLPVFVTLYSYPICVMFQAMSVGFLVAITIDRYLAVCYPFKVTTYCTRYFWNFIIFNYLKCSSRALFTVSFIVVISVAYNFVRFWEYEIVLDDNRSRSSIMFQIKCG